MARINWSRSVLAVKDLAVTRRFFVDVLGFKDDGVDMSGWAFLSRDGFKIMLGECVDALWAHETGDHSWFVCLYVDDVDALYAEFIERGAARLPKPQDKPWGLREMLVHTPDGHRMLFAQVLGA
jgi:uncharacterized glyoxalase superfamily protein PhnB